MTKPRTMCLVMLGAQQYGMHSDANFALTLNCRIIHNIMQNPLYYELII